MSFQTLLQYFFGDIQLSEISGKDWTRVQVIDEQNSLSASAIDSVVIEGDCSQLLESHFMCAFVAEEVDHF